jgi:uncharacterized damage-inducible protein DinB
MNNLPEVWLRGPVENIPALLQPAAYALQQTSEEIRKYMEDFPEEKLHDMPFGRASVAFHLKHITGVLDRMMTYSRGENLSDEQFAYLSSEKNADNQTIQELINAFDIKIKEALTYFKTIDPEILTEPRAVGRKKLPSTVIGLLFHAAEHSQRHLGQLLVTVSALKNR